MIPIHSIDSIKLVHDKVLQAGLYKEFDRLPDDYHYPEYGYFIVIESSDELYDPSELEQLLRKRCPTQSLFESLEMIEEFEGYVQIVLVLEADFGVSLSVRKEEMSYSGVLEYFSNA